MPSSWPIRNKLWLGLALLLVMVLTLFASASYGLYAYRGLVKGLRARSTEFPRAIQLIQRATELHLTLVRAQTVWKVSSEIGPSESSPFDDAQQRREDYRMALDNFEAALEHYREQLDANRRQSDSRISGDREERDTLVEIDAAIRRMRKGEEDHNWLLDELSLAQPLADAQRLQTLVHELPGHLHERFYQLSYDVRAQYRTAIAVAWATTILALLMLIVCIRMFRLWIGRPLDQLVRGSRQVAAGKFDHRIRLESRDEMGELADAMNAMTERFRQTRDDLDQQVRERTQQVVRSEQLASVGFLAAGIAHEINNPLASIAMCSESLEERIGDILPEGADTSPEREVVHNYLRMIQVEAFRCKEITERLLDFSRMGDSHRHHADLRELTSGVIDMVKHLGKYQDKKLSIREGEPVVALVNAQEIKQVVLNLVTNGLESVDPNGQVVVDVRRRGGQVEIVVEDNGCGMTEEVRQHLFEPFFTRRRGGQGTGLGLSITYRIVAEHDGTIEATSDGPGHGSRFVVALPLASIMEERHGVEAA